MLLLGSVSSSPLARLRGDEEVGVVKRASSPASTTDLILLPAREGISRPEPRQDTQDFNLPAGQALDLFYRYSYKINYSHVHMVKSLICSTGIVKVLQI